MSVRSKSQYGAGSARGYASAHQEIPQSTTMHHWSKNCPKIVQSFTITHKYTQLYALDQMDQIVHNELFGTLVKICLEKLCTILPFFALVDKIADE